MSTSTPSGTGEPEYAVPSTKPDKLPYYLPSSALNLSPILDEFLTTYSRFSPSSLLSHIQRTRDEAWSLRAYPCIGLGKFLDPPLLRQHSFYPSLLSLLNSDPDAMFLDIGCFLGIDLRFLFRDLTNPFPSSVSPWNPTLTPISTSTSSSTPALGPSSTLPSVPALTKEDAASKLVANDLVPFWSLSHTFFNDTPSTFPINFILADGLSPHSSPALSPLHHRISVLNIAQLLHQFSYAG